MRLHVLRSISLLFPAQGRNSHYQSTFTSGLHFGFEMVTTRSRSRALHASNKEISSEDVSRTDVRQSLPQRKANRNTKRQTAEKSVDKKGRAKTKSKLKTSSNSKAVVKKASNSISNATLQRIREMELLGGVDKNKNPKKVRFVIGVDEAGRGPLAGPVVAAACCWTNARDTSVIEGIIDSKKITNEHLREELYERITNDKDLIWAAAIISPQRIDEVNILQATMQGMRRASEIVVNGSICVNDSQTSFCRDPFSVEREQSCWDIKKGKSSYGSYYDEEGCYVMSNVMAFDDDSVTKSNFYCVVDGNRVPKEMPCESECMVKGDGREYCIAAASIIAKVTRDRIMNDYSKMFPEYLLSQHKGYPTKAHMALVYEHGASTIHRRSFAPLKNMIFDDYGKIRK